MLETLQAHKVDSVHEFQSAVKKTVGNNAATYNDVRNIYSLPLKRHKIKRTYDFFNVPNAFTYRLFGTSSNFFKFLHCDFGLNQVGLFHFLNTVSFGPTPWVVTFESVIPRWNYDSRFGVRLLASRACKKLIAISRNAYDLQCHHLEHFPEFRDEIKGKMCVIHPAQRSLIGAYSEKTLDENFITFTMVGHDFFYKGGREVLIAFERLIEKGCPVRLNIISKLHYGDYASKTTRQDYLDAMKRIERFPDRIRYFESLPNQEVLRILKDSHVGLLPSYADPYGYSVLEAQASGSSVITTDIRAFPETNSEEIGWVLKVPKDVFGYALIKTQAERERFSKILCEQLYEIVKNILARPESIRMKGVRCLAKIKEQHDPDQAAARVEKIYDEALVEI